MHKGLFITFEGGEGSGKSTQLLKLADYIRQSKKDVVLTREPGSTDVGKDIRRLLVEGSKEKFDEITETLLFYADRRINLTQVIFPAIKQGKIVLSDRFNDSTIAYQYYGSAKFSDTSIMDTLYNIVAPNFAPDLTFLLDIDAKKGLERSFKKAETSQTKELRFENVDISFHERLRKGYLELAQRNNNRFVIINADQSPEKVFNDICQAYNERLSSMI